MSKPSRKIIVTCAVTGAIHTPTMSDALPYRPEDIARILGLSVHTANQYLTSAGAKLDAVNRMQAVAKAIRLGLIE